MRLTGNKGEWSELYAFIKLLSTGELYAADEQANRINDIYFPILKIFRTEAIDLDMEYVIKSEDGLVEVHCNTETIRSLNRIALQKMATYIYNAIIAVKNKSAFPIEGADSIMKELACTKISAPSTDKTDITMQIQDIHTGYAPICGFSIKSELGSSPTLLNASGATNFIFRVQGLSDDEMDTINSINSKTKIIDRINAITLQGNLEYYKPSNDNFSANMMMIDTSMDKIISKVLFEYYITGESSCKSLIHKLELSNPLKYPRKGFYEYKLKKFLCSIALGMVPSKPWDGHDEANGGYVIVKNDGDVVAYHLYNRDSFETYLLNHTKLEKGSTEKHHFATLYKDEEGKMLFNMNLQIRFI